MRRPSRSVRAHVTRTDSDARPITMRLGIETYQMSIAEALDLANQLVDAAEKEQHRES